MKRIIISVINDIHTDVRVRKISEFLTENGFDILLSGIKSDFMPTKSENLNTRYQKRIFKSGALFYLEYNIRLFFYLIFSKNVDVFWSNDLDTLTANALASIIRRKPLIYDSHELFTELPELQNRKFVKRIWQLAEKLFIKRVKSMITVCDSIASYYNNKYGIKPIIIRNIPKKRNLSAKDFRKELGLPLNKKIIIYQGAVNIGRGIEELVEGIKLIDNIHLIIAGAGDISNQIAKKVFELEIQDSITLTGRLPYSEMLKYTSCADLGVSLEKNLGLNYYYALPNKLFDYIQMQIPVLVSRLPEMEKIVNKYRVGDFIVNHKPQHIADKITELLQKPHNYYSSALKTAANQLTWENESVKLNSILNDLQS